MSENINDLGQHFIVGLPGTTLRPAEAALLRKLRPLGIILFAQNVATNEASWPKTLAQLISDARDAIGREHVLVSVDHEGGRVQRLKAPLFHFKPAAHWNERSFAIGCAVGEELATLGINLNFAPVLDVLSEDRNTVIGDRAFSRDANEVAHRASEYRRGLESKGVLSCGKHFPGHGGTIQDSHFELPHYDASRELMDKCDLLPFRRLIAEEIPLLMTAHVIYPALDKDFPATISHKILAGLLRTELGFSGALVSDALEMKALAHLSSVEKAKQAIAASVDLLLVANPENNDALEQAMAMKSALSSACEHKTLSEELLLASANRLKLLVEQLVAIEARGRTFHLDFARLGNTENVNLVSALV